MAEVRPFRGVRYNRKLIKDLSAVVCPPYDIISPQMQQELYGRSGYNFVRVEYNPATPQDTPDNNRYTRAANILSEWLEQGVLVADEVPSFYLHEHYFNYDGKGYMRCGLIARVKLENWTKGVVRPHEGTLGEPKLDRMNMLRACRANTSPIMALYQDDKQQLHSLLREQAKREPVVSISGADAEIHYVWAIADSSVIDEIRSFLAQKPLYIADGHHRYESALAYQREQVSSSPLVSGDEGFNFAMMTLIDFSDPGLLVLPPHRLVRGISGTAMSSLMANLRLFFTVEELSLDLPDVWQKLDKILAGVEDRNLALFGLKPEKLLVLTLRDYIATDRMMPFFRSDMYKRLIVSVVDHVILEKLLEIGSEKESAILGYSYDKREAVKKVLNQEYQLAFLLGSIKADMVKAIADIGDRMPRKSTYFYPKLPSGLVISKW